MFGFRSEANNHGLREKASTGQASTFAAPCRSVPRGFAFGQMVGLFLASASERRGEGDNDFCVRFPSRVCGIMKVRDRSSARLTYDCAKRQTSS